VCDQSGHREAGVYPDLSERQEAEMGGAYAKEIAETMPRYDDPELQAYVEKIGQRLAATSETVQLPWSFKVHAMLGRQSELRGGPGTPNWLATHPSSADRMREM
jgi:hypothetical protein